MFSSHARLPRRSRHSPSILHDVPDIRGFLENGDWQSRFDDEYIGLAQRLRAKVRDLRFTRTTDGNITIQASVTGESCSVNCWPSGARWEFDSDCSCSFGGCCPHAAALLAAAAKPKNLFRLAGPEAPAELPPPAPPQNQDTTPTSFLLHVTRESTDSKIVRLLLQALRLPASPDWVAARPYAVRDGHRIPLGSSGSPAIQRASNAEFGAVTTLQQLGLCSLAGDPRFRFLLALAKNRGPGPLGEAGIWFPDPDQFKAAEYWPWLRCSGADLLTEAGWTIEFDPAVGHEVIDLDPDAIRYELDESGGWFQLSVGFEVGGKRLDLLPILADLLDQGSLEDSPATPAGEHILHHLDDGSALRLPVERMRAILRHFSALIDPRRFADGKLRLHPLDAAALGNNPEVDLDPPQKLARLADQLRDFDGIDATPLPRGLQAKLRVYQLSGFRWMQFLARHRLHGILADDMGLGKTMQTLAHLLAEKESGRAEGRPSLVVAPTSVVPNWQAEAARFAPGLRVLVLEGPRRHDHFGSIPHADLVLTSYALLQRDIAQLREIQYHITVLDEAQHIKNPRAKVAQAACELDARHRLCLSGTPVENHLGELWSLMRYLMPGFLGSESDFRQRFRIPIEKEEDESRRDTLKQRLAPLILRRTKDQVASELPPKIELIHTIELNTGQKDLYETVRATMDKRVRAAIAARGLEGSRMVFLEALLKLRQICCEPRLLKLDQDPAARAAAAAAGSGKLDELRDLLDTLVEEGRRILIFSQFTSMLALIEDLLKLRKFPYLLLTGASRNRGELVERFQTGEFPVFLISLKAGGTGLNLTAADTVIHYDPWWNPAAQAQATDRAHRIGQQQTVFVHKLLCKGTVEERIHQLQQKKSELAEALLADSARAAAPDAETLSALLAPVE